MDPDSARAPGQRDQACSPDGRHIGGSIGIAITGTMLARNSKRRRPLLGANVTPYDPATQSMLAQMKGAFMAAGADAATATAAPTPRWRVCCSGRPRWSRSSASSSCSA
jgi:hypothetical protein